jgi:hypothetical protein
MKERIYEAPHYATSSSVLSHSLSLSQVQIFSCVPYSAAQPDDAFLSSYGYGYVTFNDLLLRNQSFEKAWCLHIKGISVLLEKPPVMQIA